MKVRKRDKTLEVFNFEKIYNAVDKAFKSCGKETPDGVLDCVKSKYDETEDVVVDIEDIQDDVEDCLMEIDKDVAKAYIIYRYEHKVIRDNDSKLSREIKKKLMATDVQNQNANLDEHSFGGKKGEVTEYVFKDYALKNCMSRKSRNNHNNNEIYIHDLGSYADGESNCLSLPIDYLYRDGAKTRQADIRPANSINTAFQLLAVYFQIQSLQQFGGVSVTHLDWSMVPYVRKSFFKHFTFEYILDRAKQEGYDTISMTKDEWDKYKKEKRKEFKEKYGIEDEKFTIGDFSIDVVNFHIDDEKIREINNDWYIKAFDETKNELEQAVGGMYHNLNTLQSRSGNQLPFSSINYGTCTLTEGRMVIKALLEGSLDGVGKFHKTPIFPCGIFQMMNGVNKHDGEPNYDLFKLALKSTSQRLYPNYVNCDWSVNAGYDKNNPMTYTSTMGCRTYNGYDINGFGQLKDGRGNICPVTIILPTLAMEAKETYSERVKNNTLQEDDTSVSIFMKLLNKKIGEAKDMLLERFEWICSQSPKSAKFMYENGTMFGYKPEEGIRSALKHGTLAVGQLGLAECLQALIGTDHTSEEGMNLAIEIESLFARKCKEYKKKYSLNFGVYLTPAENLCYTAMKKFKAKYGEIPNVSDREYFTNSMHVPVWKEMTPFEKIDIESKLTGFSNAGCITYVELPSTTKYNLEALETIVLYAMDKDIPYFAVNVPVDVCQNCGYADELNDKCPMCGCTDIERLRRVTGYLTGNYTTAFNIGKQCETRDRTKHIKQIR